MQLTDSTREHLKWKYMHEKYAQCESLLKIQNMQHAMSEKRYTQYILLHIRRTWAYEGNKYMSTVHSVQNVDHICIICRRPNISRYADVLLNQIHLILCIQFTDEDTIFAAHFNLDMCIACRSSHQRKGRWREKEGEGCRLLLSAPHGSSSIQYMKLWILQRWSHRSPPSPPSSTQSVPVTPQCLAAGLRLANPLRLDPTPPMALLQSDNPIRTDTAGYPAERLLTQWSRATSGCANSKSDVSGSKVGSDSRSVKKSSVPLFVLVLIGADFNSWRSFCGTQLSDWLF